MIWREAVRIDNADPEYPISELENKCAETQLPANRGTIKLIDLWKVLIERKLKNDHMTKAQFAKCCLYLIDDTKPLQGMYICM